MTKRDKKRPPLQIVKPEVAKRLAKDVKPGGRVLVASGEQCVVTRTGCDRWGTRYELVEQADGTWRGEMASRSGDGPLPFVVAANVAAEWFRRAETPGIESGRAL